MEFDKLNLVEKAGYIGGGAAGFVVGGAAGMVEYGVRKWINKENDADEKASKTLEAVMEAGGSLGAQAMPLVVGALIEQWAGGIFSKGSGSCNDHCGKKVS